jgi:hypothetical protein
MQAWLVYLARSMAQRFRVRRPPEAFANKRIIVGITFLDSDGALIEQFQTHGRVVAANSAEGIVLVRPNGGRFVIPPSPQWLKAARPGEYRLRSTGEVVNDPDYLMSATLEGTAPERIAVYKTTGFEGPFS